MQARQDGGADPAGAGGARDAGGTGRVFLHFTMSLDGFIADAAGGLDWTAGFTGLSAETVTAIIESIGAALGGRHGYDVAAARGGARLYGGAWDGPVFVLTHRPGDVPADPGVTFLSGNVREAVDTARAAAGGKDVVIVGASIGQQCLAQGLADEVLLHVVPVVLGGGIRLFTAADVPVIMRPVSVDQSGDVTTMRYAVVR
jgi:dihydrofolate reductase